MAHYRRLGDLLARTNPEAPKHAGISCFLVDMTSTGLDIRPLRELTGAEMFNEVFFDEVFVPDDCVVGEIDDGWRGGPHDARQRAGLDGQRLVLRPGGGGPARSSPTEDALTTRRSSTQWAASWPRATPSPPSASARPCAALSGAEPGPEAACASCSASSTTSASRRSASVCWARPARSPRATARTWIGGYLFNRYLSIAGGTSEIQRNVIAERVLGLPKDP